jgi:4'-phosphopantetheinyl transferase EntD
MIERLLPPAVASAETFDDENAGPLCPGEEALIASAVESRRRAFTTARTCARSALADLGVAPGPILRSKHGSPQWPSGFVGSITHCDGYRAAAVARAEQIAGIGIDAEPNAALPGGVCRNVASDDEAVGLHELAVRDPDVAWDRLLFSAKESVYKAWFPLTGRWLGFDDVVVEIHRADGTFCARMLVPAPVVSGEPLRAFHGRWVASGGLVATAVVRVHHGNTPFTPIARDRE